MCDDGAAAEFHFTKDTIGAFADIEWYCKVFIEVLDLVLEFSQLTEWLAKSQIFMDGELISYDDLVETYRPNKRT